MCLVGLVMAFVVGGFLGILLMAMLFVGSQADEPGI
jgi:hypothetical protein